MKILAKWQLLSTIILGCFTTRDLVFFILIVPFSPPLLVTCFSLAILGVLCVINRIAFVFTIYKHPNLEEKVGAMTRMETLVLQEQFTYLLWMILTIVAEFITFIFF